MSTPIDAIDRAAEQFREFARVIQALRTPETGCPWDLDQDHESLRPFLLEETYEVLDAIDSADDVNLREELGDLLLQVVLHAQVAADRGAFTLAEVIEGITKKMVRRHPHVFAAKSVRDTAEVVTNWERIKAQEKAERGHSNDLAAALSRLPEALPALLRAQRLGEKTAKAGIDAKDLAHVISQVRERFEAFEAQLRKSAPTEKPSAPSERIHGEMERGLGDLLFHLCQAARWVGINAEDSLRTRGRDYARNFHDGDAAGD